MVGPDGELILTNMEAKVVHGVQQELGRALLGLMKDASDILIQLQFTASETQVVLRQVVTKIAEAYSET